MTTDIRVWFVSVLAPSVVVYCHWAMCPEDI